jgi:benzoate membrane transport protein
MGLHTQGRKRLLSPARHRPIEPVLHATTQSLSRATLLQPVFAGLLAAIVGFASSFAIVLQGFAAMGATPAQAASGLMALCVVKGCLGAGISLWSRMPISIAWSTPGAALLVATGAPAGGYGAAIGAFLVAAALIVAAGLWRRFGDAVGAIPSSLAAAMLAGVLLGLCIAPVKAVAALPGLALPIIAAWAIALRFARLYAVPAAVTVTAVLVFLATTLPPGALDHIRPEPIFVTPVFSIDALVSIALPLFIVTMASQNVPGLAVLNLNGYRPAPGPIFVATGAASGLIALFGGHVVNLAAITAALCAGPDAHPDPARRYVAAAAAGLTYIALGLSAGLAAAFVAASPPLLITCVAGLALFGSLAGALNGALAREEERLPAVVTFAVAASGVNFYGVGAAFWGLVAGGALYAVLVRRPRMSMPQVPR